MTNIAEDGGTVALSRVDDDRGLRAAMALRTEVNTDNDVGIIAARAEGSCCSIGLRNRVQSYRT